ncbi:uncharacterized protein LOC128715942 [Anopheles marshallii]|uniref:uncharacterized protein LOC128715942 n=1 Tax=Anopheles marshallii TaxID=1521116 RepID=UPI00237BAC08|nr:uncharacterized protein LOC128715942 [Anopheles marshallii]
MHVLCSRANRKRTIHSPFCLRLLKVTKAADGLHEIIVDLKALKVSDGKAGSPDVVINLKDEDFIAIGTKQVPVKDAVAQGKVSMTGDQNLFQALVDAI